MEILAALRELDDCRSGYAMPLLRGGHFQRIPGAGAHRKPPPSWKSSKGTALPLRCAYKNASRP